MSKSPRSMPIPGHIGLCLWMLGQEGERGLAFARLEMMFYLCSWKLAQMSAPIKISCSWRHDNRSVTCLGLRKSLSGQSKINVLGNGAPSTQVYRLSREVQDPIKPNIQKEIQAYHRFVQSQRNDNLVKFCLETFPVRNVPAGKIFYLKEQAIFYANSRG